MVLRDPCQNHLTFHQVSILADAYSLSDRERHIDKVRMVLQGKVNLVTGYAFMSLNTPLPFGKSRYS